MNQEIEIQEFEEWALNLGCPIEFLPPKKTLMRIFSSGQALAFGKMMNRVKPQQEVKDARDRITVHSINKANGKILSKHTKQKLPEEMQRWMKMNKLQERIKETKARLAETKSDYQRVADLVKVNNISKIQSNQLVEHRAAKVALLQANLHEVEQKIKKEQSVMAEVQKAMPVKIERSNANDGVASAAIAEAIDALQFFYSIDSNSNGHEDAYEKLWERLQDIFANIPNYILWNNLLKQKETQLMTIDVMSKQNVSKMLEVDNGTGINAAGFKTAISKLYAEHIRLELNKRALQSEKESLTSDYVSSYESFVEDLRAKYAMFNNNDIDDDLLHDYMQQSSMSCYMQAQIEYLQKSIEKLDEEISRQNEIQQDHQLMNNSLRCTYEEFETLYCKMLEDMNALNSVRAKLELNESQLRYLVQSKNEQLTLGIGGGGGRLNSSSATSSSFNSSNDSVLSSTKLDCFDNTMLMRSDMTTARPMPSLIMPQYLTELKTFLEIPMEKFKNQMSMQNQMELYGNPLVRTNAFKSIPKEMIAMIPHHLETPNSILKQYRAEYDSLVQQRKVLTELIIHEKVPTVDTAKLNQMKSTQQEQLDELTDKISVIVSKTAQVLDDVGRHFKFLVDNPLEKFIPKGKLFNGRNYYDYAREFSMYYNMLENKGAAK